MATHKFSEHLTKMARVIRNPSQGIDNSQDYYRWTAEVYRAWGGKLAAGVPPKITANDMARMQDMYERGMSALEAARHLDKDGHVN